MKLNTISTSHLSKTQIPFFVLAVMGAASAAIHVGLVAQSNDDSLLPLSLLFWLSAGSLIWQKRHQLTLHTNALSMLAGGVLIAIFLAWGIKAPTDNYLAAGPFIATVGLAVFCSSWRNLTQYRAEFILMFMFGIPKVLLWSVIDLRGITARLSTAMLQAASFDVLRDGRIISLPTGSVEVIHDCSGLNGILYLLSMSALLLIMAPIQGTKRYLVPLMGVAIAFLFNGVRVAFLAIMAADTDPQRFQHWHGTSIFSLGALGFFCAIYCLILWREKREAISSL
ncbi:cyanoexosortase A [Oscillatoria sp. CS-180]|uniref:cyanoexosortase A n=1 Tax=Oscillatoria sp. CS-180 TaxID=3021720 RepID=UPI00232C9CDA|nr:cyanoexosortase A [Oscillatoria sp. CS-180]MDB9527239.1 cyanoexosortase A [Oscillatoria sp. CS-180]